METVVVFQDREDAGCQLAVKLRKFSNLQGGLVLALPRGGVAVGYQLSIGLRLPLDVFIVRKIGAPGNPEYALGAVSETGNLFLNRQAVVDYGLSDDEVAKAVRLQQAEITRRQHLYRQGRPSPLLKDRIVILVDDGMATGATFLASAEAIRQQAPQSLVAAIPVGPIETIETLRAIVDDLAVLAVPEPFWSVGSHYARFPQLTDEEVLNYLRLAESSHQARMEQAEAGPDATG